MSADGGPEALLALIDDLSRRLAEVEKVVRDGNVHALQITADGVDVGGEVLARVVRVNTGPDGAQGTLEARHDFVQLVMRSGPTLGEGCGVSLTASDELEDGYGTVELYRHGNSLASLEVHGVDDSGRGHTALWMADPNEHGSPVETSDGRVGVTVGTKDLVRLRAMPNELVTKRVVAGGVITGHVEVMDPKAEAPTVTLGTGADAVRVGDGRTAGPHVTIGVHGGGDTDTISGRRLPPAAGVIVWADGDSPGVTVEASRGHPRRSDLGEIEVASVVPAEPSIRLAGGGAEFADPHGGGRVDINTAEDWAALQVRAKDTDQAPVVDLHTDLEGVDDRGRPAGNALVTVRHNDATMVQAGSYGAEGRPTTGYLLIGDGEKGDQDRIMLEVRAGQAQLALKSTVGDELILDSGPEGTAVAIHDNTSPTWSQWLDRDGLRGPR